MSYTYFTDYDGPFDGHTDDAELAREQAEAGAAIREQHRQALKKAEAEYAALSDETASIQHQLMQATIDVCRGVGSWAAVDRLTKAVERNQARGRALEQARRLIETEGADKVNERASQLRHAQRRLEQIELGRRRDRELAQWTAEGRDREQYSAY